MCLQGENKVKMAPEEGFEPSTHALTVRYSTVELLWN